MAYNLTVGTTPVVALQKGSTGLLPCDVQGDFDYVDWSKGPLNGGRRLLVQRAFTRGAWKKIIADESGDFDMTSDFSLVVSDVGFSHADVYICRSVVPDTVDFITNQTNLVVYGEHTNCHVFS